MSYGSDDEILNARHFHHRSGRRAGGETSSTNFDVRKTFGTYSIHIGKASSGKNSKSNDKAGNDDGTMELWRLSDDGLAVLGQMHLPMKLNAHVILAASRKTMKTAMSNLQAASTASPSGKSEDDAAQPSTGPQDGNNESESSSESEEEDEEEQEANTSTNRFATFEKNSFRSPKFWIEWQSHARAFQAAASTSDSQDTTHEQNSGYIVFNNDCKKFEATLSVLGLEWKNQKLRGWKLKSVTERANDFVWT